MMIKRLSILLCIITMVVTANAQNAGAVYEQYLDFNFARFEGQQAKALEIGEKILPNAVLLPAKSRVSYYNGLAKVYEDGDQPDKAIKYYELVSKAEPNFYVAHRALGYLYAAAADELYIKRNAASDAKEKDALTGQYATIVHNALPHLEKAQACDPSDETLDLIKILYNNLKDKAGLDGLNERLKAGNKNCIDILSDQ